MGAMEQGCGAEPACGCSNLWSFHLRASVFFGKKDIWSSTKKIENKEVSEIVTYRKDVKWSFYMIAGINISVLKLMEYMNYF